MKLDRFGTFFKDVEQSSKPKPKRPEPILPTLPIPEPPRTPSMLLYLASPPPYSEPTSIPSSPKISTQGLFISPPDADEISPTLLTSTLPSLLPSNPAETAAASAYSRSFGPTPTARKLAGAHTSTALQEELSSQLEVMAQQLKRNALHFSNSLEKDKAVIEDAGLKLEGNYDVMLKERLRLRDHRGKSRSTTCLIMGVVLLVVVVFMLMVSVIRFS
ncbi:hypothetical protein BDZ97DRAFT_1811249 [Flammula alnicola]|nr:hypothetical protein BDZ97DRAFT_1811249 [Flammula alnicola]